MISHKPVSHVFFNYSFHWSQNHTYSSPTTEGLWSLLSADACLDWSRGGAPEKNMKKHRVPASSSQKPCVGLLCSGYLATSYRRWGKTKGMGVEIGSWFHICFCYRVHCLNFIAWDYSDKSTSSSVDEWCCQYWYFPSLNWFRKDPWTSCGSLIVVFCSYWLLVLLFCLNHTIGWLNWLTWESNQRFPWQCAWHVHICFCLCGSVVCTGLFACRAVPFPWHPLLHTYMHPYSIHAWIP